MRLILASLLLFTSVIVNGQFLSSSSPFKSCGCGSGLPFKSGLNIPGFSSANPFSFSSQSPLSGCGCGFNSFRLPSSLSRGCGCSTPCVEPKISCCNYASSLGSQNCKPCGAQISNIGCAQDIRSDTSIETAPCSDFEASNTCGSQSSGFQSCGTQPCGVPESNIATVSEIVESSSPAAEIAEAAANIEAPVESIAGPSQSEPCSFSPSPCQATSQSYNSQCASPCYRSVPCSCPSQSFEITPCACPSSSLSQNSCQNNCQGAGLKISGNLIPDCGCGNPGLGRQSATGCYGFSGNNNCQSAC